MVGLFLGDIIGSPFEFDRGDKIKNFELFTDGCSYTDDTIMACAISEAVATCINSDSLDDESIKARCIERMQAWGERYPHESYGARFIGWLRADNPQPYNSYGNGSAMRVGFVGWAFNEIDEVRRVARLTAEVTHNHPEGIKGAEATASAVFLARNGYSKKEIKDYIENEFNYDLSRTCDEIRPTYFHVESCQETVPEAITAFLEGNDFEDCIRTAVSLGGDCDTLAAITGSIAEAFYGVPPALELECIHRIPADVRGALLVAKTMAFFVAQKGA